MTADYESLQPLKFRLSRKGSRSGGLLSRLFGRKKDDAREAPGEPKIDVDTDDEATMRRLLSNPTLSAAFQSRHLDLKTDGSQLVLETREPIADIEAIRAAHDLMVETLRELQHLRLIR